MHSSRAYLSRSPDLDTPFLQHHLSIAKFNCSLLVARPSAATHLPPVGEPPNHPWHGKQHREEVKRES